MRRGIGRTAAFLVVTGVSLYLVFPSIVQVFSAWPELATLAPAWFAAMVLAEAVSFWCMWALQRIALRSGDRFAVATSQLAGNAFGRIVPGGAAAAGALQYRMLVQAGTGGTNAATGLTASSLVVVATLLAMPVLVVPAIVRGSVSTGNDLVRAALFGLAAFAALFALGALLAVTDRPLRALGRAVQSARNRLRRGAPPMTRLPERLLEERDMVRRVLGRRWWEALLGSVGRWFFDYLALLAALAAVGAHPSPTLVLLSYTAAQALGQLPLTPGGLGFVEAGLTGTLALAGVRPGDAVLATLVYRLVSYWLPLPAGLAAWVLHRRRYGRTAPTAEAR